MRLITAAFARDLFLVVSAAAILAERRDVVATFAKKSTKVSGCRQKFFAVEKFHGTKELGIGEQAELGNGRGRREEVAEEDGGRDGEAESVRVKREEERSGEGSGLGEEEKREKDETGSSEEEGDAEREGNEGGGTEVARDRGDYDERAKKIGGEEREREEEIGGMERGEDDEGSLGKYSGETEEKENEDGDEGEKRDGEEKKVGVESDDGKNEEEEFSRVVEAVERTTTTKVNDYSGEKERRGETKDVEKSGGVEIDDPEEFLEELRSRLLEVLREMNSGGMIRKMVRCMTLRGRTPVAASRGVEDRVGKKLRSDDFRAEVARLLRRDGS